MGYNLHIERIGEANKISTEDWKGYMDSDPEFSSIEELSSAIRDGKRIIIETPNAGLWSYKNNELPFTFSENRGSITVKNPNNEIIKKMIAISRILNAVVIGDEEEIYDEEYLEKVNKEADTVSADFPDYKDLKVKPFDFKYKKWWEFWK